MNIAPIMDLDSLAKHFPEARYHPAWRLVAWHPTGPLDNDQVDRIVEFLESQEKIEGEYFNRYTDMTGHTRIKIGLDHIVRIARRRREGYVGAPVKSAFYAVRAISLSIARMYEELMSGSQIQVCTFRSRAAAADWLGVPPEALEPQKGS